MKNENNEIEKVNVLIDSNELYERIKQVAAQINDDYDNSKVLNIICVLKGAFMFCSELIKYLKMPIKVEFVSLSSYGDSHNTTGRIKALNMTLPEFKDEDVLIIEDIIDTGLTLQFLNEFIEHNCKAKSVKTAVLLDKAETRKIYIEADYKCFNVADMFVVGFGLDDKQLYRNLNYVGYIE